jgi:hypothetical protein
VPRGRPGVARGRRASRLATGLALVAAVLVAVERLDLRWPGGAQRDPGAAVLEQAWRERRSDVWVEASGRVDRVLPDDRRGSRHQRFLVRIRGGPRVLVAHNIGLAARSPDLERGDRVRFQGEYEWNEQGGVVHWTHRDPDGRRPGGWIEHGGRRWE